MLALKWTALSSSFDCADTAKGATNSGLTRMNFRMRMDGPHRTKIKTKRKCNTLHDSPSNARDVHSFFLGNMLLEALLSCLTQEKIETPRTAHRFPRAQCHLHSLRHWRAQDAGGSQQMVRRGGAGGGASKVRCFQAPPGNLRHSRTDTRP